MQITKAPPQPPPPKLFNLELSSVEINLINQALNQFNCVGITDAERAALSKFQDLLQWAIKESR